MWYVTYTCLSCNHDHVISAYMYYVRMYMYSLVVWLVCSLVYIWCSMRYFLNISCDVRFSSSNHYESVQHFFDLGCSVLFAGSVRILANQIAQAHVPGTVWDLLTVVSLIICCIQFTHHDRVCLHIKPAWCRGRRRPRHAAAPSTLSTTVALHTSWCTRHTADCCSRHWLA